MDVSAALLAVVPVAAVFVAFLLNRGSSLRRTRGVALEDIQLAEAAGRLITRSDPLTDQLEAQARESANLYIRLRSNHATRVGRYTARVSLVVASLVLAAALVRYELTDPWVVLAFGVLGGVIGASVETGLERFTIRRAVRDLPTAAQQG